MYHYVRGETDRPPTGYYHLDEADFGRQLDSLERNHTFLSKAQFRQSLRGDRTPPDDGVVLTFDDGLADHHEWVLPELRDRGLWGVFFVATAPLVSDRRLPVHRVHTLVSEYPGPELLSQLREILRAEGVELTDGEDMYAGRDTDDSVRRFKHLLNRAVPDARLSGVLDRLESAFPAARTDSEALYCTAEQLRDLSEAGMVVGAHSVTHPVLADLPPAAQRFEIAASRRQLRELVDQPVDLFAYPYGGADSYTDRTVEFVREAGFTAAFTTVQGDIGDRDIAGNALTLPRLDCADLAHGESSFSLPTAE